MLEPRDFFQQQAEQCHALAARAGNKKDREFWLQLAHRWKRLLQAGNAATPTERDTGFGRPMMKKKTFAQRMAKYRAA